MLVCVVWLTIATLTFELFEGLFLFMCILVHIITLRLLFTSIATNMQVCKASVVCVPTYIYACTLQVILQERYAHKFECYLGNLST